MTKKAFILLLNLMALTVHAQTVIKGKVIDKNDLPLTGVNVSVKGTNQGTITDIDGNFSLTCKGTPKNTDIIVFNFLGYETKKHSIRKNETEWDDPIEREECLFERCRCNSFRH